MRLLIVSLALGFFVSLFVTVVAWNIQIEHRALHCTDDVGFGFFWEDLEAHEQARDTLSPSWTWEKLSATQKKYDIAFFSIWLIVVATYIMINLTRRRQPSAHSA
jgi:hypothetical protein